MPIKIKFFVERMLSEDRSCWIRQLNVIMNESESKYVNEFYNWYLSGATPLSTDRHSSYTAAEWEIVTQRWMNTLQDYFEKCGRQKHVREGVVFKPAGVKEAQEMFRLARILATIEPEAHTCLELEY